jgi:thiol:disulfide interchange protein
MRLACRLVLFALAACSADATHQPASLWATDEASAFAQARAKGKGVVVELYAEWVTPCHELDRELRSPTIAGVLAPHWIPVKLDVTEDDARTQEVRARYAATTLPAVLLVRADGTVIDRITSLIDEAELARRLQPP